MGSQCKPAPTRQDLRLYTRLALYKKPGISAALQKREVLRSPRCSPCWRDSWLGALMARQCKLAPTHQDLRLYIRNAQATLDSDCTKGLRASKALLSIVLWTSASRPQTRRRPQAITSCPRRAGRPAGRPAGSHAQWVSSGIPCFAPHGAGKENSSLRSVWAGSSPPWSVGRSFTRIPPAGVCVRPGSTSGSSSPSHCGSSSFCSLFFFVPTLETSGQVC